jgi:3'-phosphoadenosine 5'-phosphosulfate sulfotransferase (PAPS reductase)/FAD synthetase
MVRLSDRERCSLTILLSVRCLPPRKSKHLKRPHSGCYSLAGAIQSAAATPAEIVAEVRDTRRSERQGRLIDNDEEAAMERKKREGYF